MSHLIVELLLLVLPTEIPEGLQDGVIAIPEPDIGGQNKTEMPEQTVCYPVRLSGALQQEFHHWRGQVAVILDGLEINTIVKIPFFHIY